MVHFYRLFVTDEDHEPIAVQDAKMLLFCKTFLWETSLAGLPQLVKQPGIIKKMFWLLAIGGMAFGLYFFLADFFDGFTTWQANTKVSIETSRSLYFPAVTVCNNNPVLVDWYSGRPSPSGGGTGGSSGGTSAPSGGTPAPTGGTPAPTGGAPTPASGGSTSGGTTPSGGSTAPPPPPPPPGRRRKRNVPTGDLMTMSVKEAVDRIRRAGPGPAPGPAPGGTAPAPGGTAPAPGGTAPAPGGTGPAPGGTAPGPATGGTAPAGGTGGKGGAGPAPPYQQPQFAGPVQTKFSIQEKASKVLYQNRSLIGHQLCDMILSCQYGGVACSPGSAFKTWHWNSNFGNCYTFNPGYSEAESPEKVSKDPWTLKIGGDQNDGVRVSKLPGDTYGLYLLLNLDTDHYVSTTTELGWRITVHNQTDMPFPEENGVFMPPGASLRVGMSLNYVEKLGVIWNGFYNASYSECVPQEDLDHDSKDNVYSTLLEIGYTQTACYKTCYQRAVMKKCQCYDFGFPNQGKAFSESGTNTLPPCSYTDSKQWECRDGVEALYQADTLGCGEQCPKTCQSYSISTTTSQMKWPNPSTDTLKTVCQNILTILKLRISNNDTTCNGSSNIQQMIAGGTAYKLLDDLYACTQGTFVSPIESFYELAEYIIGTQFAEVYIYYKDFNYQTVVEAEPTTFADLLSYLGGMLGLFFGFSFMTMIEYVQLAFDLIAIAVGKLAMLCCGKKNKTGDVPGNNDGQSVQPVKPPSGRGGHIPMPGGYPVDSNNLYAPAKPSSAFYLSNYPPPPPPPVQHALPSLGTQQPLPDQMPAHPADPNMQNQYNAQYGYPYGNSYPYPPPE